VQFKISHDDDQKNEGDENKMLQLKNAVCPSCNSFKVQSFYEAKNVPVNSCMMFSNSEDAVNFPRGDVELGFCRVCGFIYNMTFDSSKLDYSSLAPEEQGFSGTFNAYAQRLADRLIQTYELQHKHISEIGCGRGDFLALLCELGNNEGVGIDPSTVSGGVQSKAMNRLKFIRDYYSESHAEHLGDFVCCRHTLEHIPNTAEFVKSVRSAIGTKKTTVFFEVPDVSRILNEVAFWDIYYEHCSYFNLGSLARLFRHCNFEVTNLLKDYFDQYLLLEGKPVSTPPKQRWKNLESVECTAKSVELFAKKSQSKLNQWKDQLKGIILKKKRAIVWGSGSKCVAFMTTLNVKDEIDYVVDINPNRHGKFIPGAGKQIIPPESLREYKPDTVIVMNPVYVNEIRQKLESMNIHAELIPCQ
jgi:SAM-dependent methyltransferase